MNTISLPTLTPTDLDLETEVINALETIDSLRPTEAEITVKAEEGVVTLSGYVPSCTAVTDVERAVRAVPHVVQVINHLLDDGTLSRAAAQALATHPATRQIPPGYKVTAFIGHVFVIGRFADDAARAAVAEVCRAIPGVRSAQIKAF